MNKESVLGAEHRHGIAEQYPSWTKANLGTAQAALEYGDKNLWEVSAKALKTMTVWIYLVICKGI